MALFLVPFSYLIRNMDSLSRNFSFQVSMHPHSLSMLAKVMVNEPIAFRELPLGIGQLAEGAAHIKTPPREYGCRRP